MSEDRADRISYLLRLWRANSGTVQGGVWRAMLENAHTGQRICFANLLELFAFLENATAGPQAFSLSPDGTAPFITNSEEK